MNTSEANRRKILFLARFSVLLIIEAIFCFYTPLGSIPIGPLVATLAMVPVVITAIMLGTKAGSLMGFIAGLFSFIVWTFMPPPSLLPLGFVFSPFYPFGNVSGNFYSLIICFVPRILVGTVTGLSLRLLIRIYPRKDKKAPVLYAVSGCLGSLTNTFLVLGGIYVFFGRDYASVMGIAHDMLLWAIGASILTNGVPEAVIAGLAAYFVCRVLQRHYQTMK